MSLWKKWKLLSAISRHPSKGLRQNAAHPFWSQANHRKYVKLKFKISSHLFLHKWWQSSSTASAPTVCCSWMKHKIIYSTKDASWLFVWNANKNEWRTTRWLCTRPMLLWNRIVRRVASVPHEHKVVSNVSGLEQIPKMWVTLAASGGSLPLPVSLCIPSIAIESNMYTY